MKRFAPSLRTLASRPRFAPPLRVTYRSCSGFGYNPRVWWCASS
jgi:hypothetical protein